MRIDRYTAIEQKTVLSRELQQSLNILSMNNQDLTAYILKESEESPAIEIQECFDISTTGFNHTSRGSRYTVHEVMHEQSFNVQNYKDESLEDYLKGQIELNLFDSKEYKTLVTMIQYIDDKGYIKESNDELAYLLNLSKEDIIRLKSYIQTLKPYGIGAQDFKESLVIQLIQRGLYEEKIETIIYHYLEDLSRGNFNKIARQLKISKEEVKKYYNDIKRLNPKPANGFGVKEQEYIVPDMVVEINKNKYEVNLNERYLPKVVISSYWSTLIKQTNDLAVQQYIKEKYKQAQHLIVSLEERNKTLKKVGEIIVRVQYQFFRTGEPIYLVPLRIQDIAEEIGVHESTISRAINTKYILCRHGVFSLKYFVVSRAVSKSTRQSDAKEDRSKENIKQEIKKIIQQEVHNQPLSDSEIEKVLKRLGIQLSRRTVVKYREELGIPNSFQRGI